MFILGVIAAVIVVWVIVGGFAGSSSGAPRGPECEGCVGLDRWFASLRWYTKIAVAAWYLTTKAACGLRGCRTD